MKAYERPDKRIAACITGAFQLLTTQKALHKKF